MTMSGAKVWTSWSRIHVEHCSPDAERGNRRSRKKNHSLLVAARHIETIIDPRAQRSANVSACASVAVQIAATVRTARLAITISE